MILTLKDWKGRNVDTDIGNKNNIGAIYIEVLSGDETAIVVHKDYTIERFDSFYGKRKSEPDGSYLLYHDKQKVNLLENEKWLNRSDSDDGINISYQVNTES